MSSASRVAVLAGLIYATAAVVYVVLLQQQGSGLTSLTGAVETLLWGMAVAALAGGLVPRRRLRLGLLSSSAIAGLCLGVLALFSIGLLVLIGGLLAAVAYARAVRATRPRGSIVASLAGAVVALAALGAVFVPTMAPGVSIDCQSGSIAFKGGWGFFAGSRGRSPASSSSTMRGRAITGTYELNGHVWHYVCRDGNLVTLARKR